MSQENSLSASRTLLTAGVVISSLLVLCLIPRLSTPDRRASSGQNELAAKAKPLVETQADNSQIAAGRGTSAKRAAAAPVTAEARVQGNAGRHVTISRERFQSMNSAGVSVPNITVPVTVNVDNGAILAELLRMQESSQKKGPSTDADGLSHAPRSSVIELSSGRTEEQLAEFTSPEPLSHPLAREDLNGASAFAPAENDVEFIDVRQSAAVAASGESEGSQPVTDAGVAAVNQPDELPELDGPEEDFAGFISSEPEISSRSLAVPEKSSEEANPVNEFEEQPPLEISAIPLINAAESLSAATEEAATPEISVPEDSIDAATGTESTVVFTPELPETAVPDIPALPHPLAAEMRKPAASGSADAGIPEIPPIGQVTVQTPQEQSVLTGHDAEPFQMQEPDSGLPEESSSEPEPVSDAEELSVPTAEWQPNEPEMVPAQTLESTDDRYSNTGKRQTVTSGMMTRMRQQLSGLARKIPRPDFDTPGWVDRMADWREQRSRKKGPPETAGPKPKPLEFSLRKLPGQNLRQAQHAFGKQGLTDPQAPSNPAVVDNGHRSNPSRPEGFQWNLPSLPKLPPADRRRVELPTVQMPTMRLPSINLPTLHVPQWDLPGVELSQWQRPAIRPVVYEVELPTLPEWLVNLPDSDPLEPLRGSATMHRVSSAVRYATQPRVVR